LYNNLPKKGYTMIINHNLSAQFAFRNMEIAGDSADRVMERLTTGIRVNRTADDPSQLGFDTQIRGLNQASRNASNGLSFIQVSEGYLQETQDIIHRLRELAVQASNGIYTNEDRSYIQTEVSQLVSEIDRIASHAQFNGMNLLTGRFAHQAQGNDTAAAMWLHIGANMDQRERVFIGTMTTAGLNIRNAADGSINLDDQDSANRAIGTLDEALKIISKQRADLGAYQNRLEYAIQGIDSGSENLLAAHLRIHDANMATEMVSYTRDNIVSQAGEAMLAQANQRPQAVLQLLR
jgi:flagellin